MAGLSIPTQSQAGVMSLGVSLPTKWMCSRQLQVISLVDGFVALWSELTSNTSSLYVRLHVRCLRILLRKNLCRRLHSQRACMINHELCRRVRRWGYRSDRAAACNMTNEVSVAILITMMTQFHRRYIPELRLGTQALQHTHSCVDCK